MEFIWFALSFIFYNRRRNLMHGGGSDKNVKMEPFTPLSLLFLLLGLLLMCAPLVLILMALLQADIHIRG